LPETRRRLLTRSTRVAQIKNNTQSLVKEIKSQTLKPVMLSLSSKSETIKFILGKVQICTWRKKFLFLKLSLESTSQ
jgi:hypothetical protein